MQYEFLVVGAGLTGAVIARMLTDAGKRVLVLDRRPFVGGNLYDYVHESGIRIQAYGPHYFRTNDKDLWIFVNRFAVFHKFEAKLMSWVDGQYVNWPVLASYIQRLVGHQWAPEFRGIPANFEQASLAMMPRLVYEKLIKEYTEKQWGVPAKMLSADLSRRFDVRDDGETRLVRHRYQGIPTEGYAAFVQKMLAGVPFILNCDYLSNRTSFSPTSLTIYTGPVDEYFEFDLGRLQYRGQRRNHEYLPDIAKFALPCVQVNNPSAENGLHIRTVEWKYLMPKKYAERVRGTVLTRETPYSPAAPEDYEYPFPDEANRRLYQTYRERVRATKRLCVCGRLGDYRYYDMDQAISRAQMISTKILRANDDVEGCLTCD